MALSLVAQTSGIWTLQSPLPTGQNLNGLSMVSATEGWAVGDGGVILSTTDGGVTWTPQDSGTSVQLTAVQFLDSQHGWAVGNDVLYTTNGGQTWLKGQYSGATLYGISMVNASTGWAVGGSGTIVATTNGGRTWVGQQSTTSQNLTSVSFTDDNNGWAVGGDGAIVHTINGGSTWSTQASGTKAFFGGVTFVNPSDGWAAAGNVLVSTKNGGATWQPQTLPANAYVSSIFFLAGCGNFEFAKMGHFAWVYSNQLSA
jgi:photosystem II stability/assembly factor-like uncharacterized protein